MMNAFNYQTKKVKIFMLPVSSVVFEFNYFLSRSQGMEEVVVITGDWRKVWG